MSIKFICTCGKHLRAKDEMARMRTVCPGCGRIVGVPSGEPTQRGTSPEPLTPAERLARDQEKAAFKVFGFDSPADTPPKDADLGYRVVVLAEEKGPAPPRPPAHDDALSRQRAEEVLNNLLGPDRTHEIKRRIRSGRRRPFWPLERHWYECLFFPLRAWALILGLAMALTWLSAV